METKVEIAKSESWLHAIQLVGGLLATILGNKAGAGTWVPAAVMLASTLAYATFRTPLVSDRPGWKTKAFWGSLATILLAVCAAIAEADLPGIPGAVTRTAGVIVAALTALGYSVIRVKAKRALAAAKVAKPQP